jgi:hypothetical protein
MFGTLQDRLPKELKLAGITDMESANRFIVSGAATTRPHASAPDRYRSGDQAARRTLA